MFESVHDFFFGDQLRKRVVLISAFFLGQICVMPLLGWRDPSHYVTLAVVLSLVFVWPLNFLYNRFSSVQRERTGELRQEEPQPSDQELIRQIIRQIEAMLYDMASRKWGRLPEGQTRDTIVYFIETRMLSPKFLQDYDRLKDSLHHENSLSTLDNAKELLMRLHAVFYANEKAIYEMSSDLERAMIRNFEALKGYRVSSEAIGGMMLKMGAYIRWINDISYREVEQIIEEHKKTHT
jgi:hypothetical protein